MSNKLVWQETKQPGGATVVFQGTPASPVRAWLGVSAIVFAAMLVYFTYFPTHPKPVTKEAFIRVMPAVLSIAGMSLIIGQMPGISAGTLHVGEHAFGARIRVVPAAGWRLETEVPIADIEHVSCETEDDDGKEGRYRVYAMTRSSGRRTIAMFADADSALFMAQRLEALLERARSFKG